MSYKRFVTKSKLPQYHIIDGKEVKNNFLNPFHANADKSEILKILIDSFPMLKFFSINSKSNIFKIQFTSDINKVERFMSIDTPDHGGKIDGSFKIEIPINKKNFQKQLLNTNITVMNLFIPLKTVDNKNGYYEVDKLNVIAIIMNPLQIYSGKGYSQLIYGKLKEISPSSRWLKWETIKTALKTGEDNFHKPNKARFSIKPSDYLYVVPSKKFHEGIFTQFEHMELSEQIKEWKIEAASKKNNKNIIKKIYNSSAKIFRDSLIKELEGKKMCSIEGCGIKPSDLLVASHSMDQSYIKKLELSIEEKAILISDKNNGLLLCREHDGYYDKGYITFDSTGVAKISSRLNLHSKIRIIPNLINNKRIHFFEYHNKYIFKK